MLEGLERSRYSTVELANFAESIQALPHELYRLFDLLAEREVLLDFMLFKCLKSNRISLQGRFLLDAL